MRLAVVVPTYRRPAHLAKCLDALVRQTRPADQIIVVMRQDDNAAAEICAGKALTTVRVDSPGVAHAYNAGLATATTDIVTFTDDDAEPDPDWIAKLLASYGDHPGIAGVGGRDILPATRDGPEVVVGRMQWFGRTIGNHHRGTGPARHVDILKGVNMSFRSTAIAGLNFDETLRGSGAQVGVELGFCLALRRRGHRLLYDPAITVRHDPGPRADADQRGHFVAASLADSVHNLTYLTLQHLTPARRWIFLAYGGLIGTRGEPGLAQFVRMLLTGDRHATEKFRAAWRGRCDGLDHFRGADRKAM